MLTIAIIGETITRVKQAITRILERTGNTPSVVNPFHKIALLDLGARSSKLAMTSGAVVSTQAKALSRRESKSLPVTAAKRPELRLSTAWADGKNRPRPR